MDVHGSHEHSGGIEDHEEVHLVWNKYDEPVIDDSLGHFEFVKVNSFLQDGYLWVIFDLKLNTSMHEPHILVETWHESKIKNKIEILDMFEVIPLSLLYQNPNVVKHTETILISHTSSHPSCVNLDVCFLPSYARIFESGMIEWRSQDDSLVHTITSGTPENGPDNKFNFILTPMNSVSKSFPIPGAYSYFCTIHPWMVGIVDVYPKLKTIDGRIIIPTELNVAGNVDIPEITLYPITVHSLADGESVLVEQNKSVFLENRDLKFVVSGHVEKSTSNSIKIQIFRPDGTDFSMNTFVNQKGDYFVPVKLSDRWLSGGYEIKSFYDGTEIGSISFNVNSN